MNGTCDRWRERIPIEESLNAEERTGLWEHLADCEECRAWRDALVVDGERLDGYVRSLEGRMGALEGRVLNGLGAPDAQPGALSRFTRLLADRWFRVAAVAAIVLLIVLGRGLPTGPGGSTVALAEVIARVEHASGYICRIIQRREPGPMRLEVTEYHNRGLGLRQDAYAEGRLLVRTIVAPEDSFALFLLPRNRAWMRLGLNQEEAASLHQNSDPVEIVRYIKGLPYHELGTRRIRGVRAVGFEVDDPVVFAETYEEGVLQLWVDTNTGWPVQISFSGTADDGRIRDRTVMDRFRWDPELTEEDFPARVPDDWVMWADVPPARNDEASACTALQIYGRLTEGRYPSDPALLTAMSLLDRILDQNPRSRNRDPGLVTEILQLRNLSGFYARLLKEDREVAWYGETVTERDVDRVLLRWRLEDGTYRVIFGDLHTETVSPERLAELEQVR